MSLLLEEAEQVFRVPVGCGPFLRHDRAGEISLEGGSIVVDGDRICDQVAAGFDRVIDCRGGALLPGFVDCHTHLPFAGWRAEEYEKKVMGVGYEEIAASGGGIASSAKALANASDSAVLRQATEIRAEMLAYGTTCFEAKSGYGLSVEAEQRLVGLARDLDAAVVTGLFAHSVPPGWEREAWMDAAERLARRREVDALDIYVESVAFGNEDLRRFGELAKSLGLPFRAHVEQFNCNRSVPVAIEVGARSVDHLARLHPDDVAPLAAAECGAVLLPGAEFLGAEELPPARDLADAGAICVVATDCNPGTSPIDSLPLAIGIAVRRYGWSVREALLAVTLNAAWVLGLADEIGSIELGKRADLVLLDCAVEQIGYRFGRNPVAIVIREGEPVWVRPDQGWRVSR